MQGKSKSAPLQVLECQGISQRPSTQAWIPLGVALVALFVAARFIKLAVLLLVPILGFAGVVWMARLYIAPRLCLHEDGVRFGFSGKMRFLPFEKMIDVRLVREYSQIENAMRSVDVVFIFKLLNGHRGRFVVACHNERGMVRDGEFVPEKPVEIDENANQMLDAIRSRIRRTQGSETDLVKAALASDTSNIAVHLTRLRSIVPGKDGYRSIPVSRENLLEIVEDPSAGPRLRVSAAIVLRAANHPGDPERVKAAANNCASPALGSALTYVSDSAENDERAFRVLSEEIL